MMGAVVGACIDLFLAVVFRGGARLLGRGGSADQAGAQDEGTRTALRQRIADIARARRAGRT